MKKKPAKNPYQTNKPGYIPAPTPKKPSPVAVRTEGGDLRAGEGRR